MPIGTSTLNVPSTPAEPIVGFGTVFTDTLAPAAGVEEPEIVTVPAMKPVVFPSTPLVPGVPLVPLVPLPPAGPCGPCSPCGPAGPVQAATAIAAAMARIGAS